MSIAFILISLLPLSAGAQTQPAQPGTQTDVRSATRKLVRSGQVVSQSSAVVQDPNPVRTAPLVRIIPFPRKSGSTIKNTAPAGAHLTYWGGPVISNIHIIAVFWGPSVAAAITTNGAIDQFYTDISSSRYFDLLTEYTTAGITGADGVSTSNQTIGHGSFDGKFTITPSLCPGTAACTITDAQIQTELTSQINSHALPAPQSDASGNVNTYYAIYFPPNVTISLDPTTNSCVQGGFCAYHSNTANSIPYGVFPDFSTGGCSVQRACGSGTTLQIATGVSSHEMGEAITDAQVGSATTFAPPLGWFDSVNNMEIADVCDPFTDTVTAGTSTYTVELLFSNLQNFCVKAPPVFNMPSPVGGAGPSVPFTMLLTVQSSIPNFVGGLDYRGTVHFTSSDQGAVLPSDYTFTATDAGSHKFPFTLAGLGDQTITVTDIRSSGFTGTTTVNVNTVPDMTLTLSHAGNFGLGQVGATYTIVASNLGGGPSAGTVTIADTLPGGMTATAMTGAGWICTVASVTCTRTDSLAAGSSYPPITLTVNVSTLISSSVINTATISGGGETLTSDNVANDPTTIVTAGIDLITSLSSPQLTTTQGSTGVTFSARVLNFGSVASSGAVTLSASLSTGMTATAMSGTGWSCTVASLTCTRSDVLASAASYPDVTITFDVALNAVSGSVSATVSGGGDANTSDNTSTAIANIAPALSIFSGAPSVTVLAGTPASYRLGVFGNAAAGTVTFSCSGLPAASSCSFNPPSLTNNSLFVTLTLNTTARAIVVPEPGPGKSNPWLFPELLLLAVTVTGTRLLVSCGTRRKLVPILGVCVLLFVAVLTGCGGGGSSTTTIVKNIQGTPAGRYTITFTATSSNTNIEPVSRTVTIVVQ
jgi:hypothetical protein